MYEIADDKKTTVGELTGTRRRYSTVHLPEGLARFFGLDDDESVIHIEHHDEGLSASEIPFITALKDIQAREQRDQRRANK